MFDKTYVGNKASKLDDKGTMTPISRVSLFVDDDNYYTAGDDTGRELTLSNPHATQAMADYILSMLGGYQHKPFEAQDALLDPAAEMGDGVTVGDVYSSIGQMTVEFSPAYTVKLSAPGSKEIDEEFGAYVSQSDRDYDRKLAQTRSLITKTSEEIQLLVENELEGLSASITVQLDSITSQITGLNGQVSTIEQTVSSITTRVTGLEGDYSSLEQYVDSITLTVSNGSESSTITLRAGSTTISSANITFSGMVTFTDLSTAGSTVINGSNITTGTISASRINLTGAITWSALSTSVQNEIDDAYSLASSASSTASSAYSLASSTSSTVSAWRYGSTTYIDGAMLMTGTVYATYLRGGTIGILNSSGTQIGYMTVGSSTSTGLQLVSGGNLYFASASCTIQMSSRNIAISCDNFYPAGTASYLGTSSNLWQAVYSYTSTIQTSDENIKHDIAEIPQKYLDMMDDIVPVIYKMDNGTSDRYHTGFVAQNVKAAMDAHGVSDTELAAWCSDVDEEGNEIQMLRYSEFIAILWAKIKQLEAKINGTG